MREFIDENERRVQVFEVQVGGDKSAAETLRLVKDLRPECEVEMRSKPRDGGGTDCKFILRDKPFSLAAFFGKMQKDSGAQL